MSHRNGIIYVDTSQNPPVGISIEDIRAVLSSSRNDIGSLIRSGKVNRWAKFKPVRHQQIGFVTLTQRIEAGHGFGPVSPLAWSVIQGNSLPDSFEYLPPRGMGGGTGGTNEWFRFFDFAHIETDLSQLGSDGYNHNAIAPIDWFLHIDGMDDAKVLSFNTFYRRLSDVKVRAKYRIGNRCSIGSPGNMELGLDELSFYTGGGSVGNVGNQFKLCVTNYASGALHAVEAPQVLNVLTDTGAGVGFEIDLSSVMPGGGGQAWPQDQDTGFSFYPRFKDKDTSTYWSAIIGAPLRLVTYFFNPLEITFNGSIAFYGARIGETARGVEILSAGNGKLAQAGGEDGFVIKFVNDQKVNKPQDVIDIAKKARRSIVIEGITATGRQGYFAFGKDE